MRCMLPILIACVIFGVDASAQGPASLPKDHAEQMKQGLELFRSRVGTILKRNCIECHGAKRTEAKLDLTTREGLIKGGESGPALSLGQTGEKSLLVRLITHQAEPHMPLDAKPLPQNEVEAITKWIELGAPYLQALAPSKAVARRTRATDEDRQFWSFRPLTVVQPPSVKEVSWCENVIDRFILAKMERHNARPTRATDPEQLVRRAYLDLLGLPPPSDVLNTYLQDARHDPKVAFRSLADQLLASPAYGERWARHWLDLVRFAESYGFEHDLDNDHAYHYRDFVIWALNQDLSYDDFVRWQIAGDELAPDEPLAHIATGFLAAGVHNADIAKVRVEQERYDELDDLVSTVGTSMLGLSLGCARCHDHKFDPISQQNYYQLIATFERTVRGEVELPSLANPSASKVLVAGEGVPPLARVYNPGPAFFTNTWFLDRGDARLKSHEVFPAFLDVLTPAHSPPHEWRVRPQPIREPARATTYRRSALARWLADIELGSGALLARVIANRIWQHHFGRGIVTTPSDFGSRGAAPTHPQLLDYLAWELIRHDWSLKHLHRLIMQSATYQQSVLQHVRSPLDDQLFRGRQLRRLEAEAIRDQMLVLSGAFDNRMYGPGTLDESQPRRSIYFRVKRSRLIPLMTLFDAPDALQGTAERPTTTVAPQALALLNAGHVKRLAMGFADRLTREAAQSLDAAVRRAYREALARQPSAEELRDAIAFIQQQRHEHEANQQQRVDLPAALPDSVVWLDASELASGAVSAWQSRSGSRLTFHRGSQRSPVAERSTVTFGPEPTFLKANDDPSLNFGLGDFSITVVFRPTAASHLLGKDSYPGSGNNYTGYFLQPMNRRLRFATRNLRDGKGPVNYLDSEPILKSGQWHRVTAVRESATLQLYFDDAHTVHKSMREQAATNVDFPTGFKIGEMDDDASGAFRGSVAEVLVYERALSSEEVRHNHIYLAHKHLGGLPRSPLGNALTDFCQALFCSNEFVYVD